MLFLYDSNDTPSANSVLAKAGLNTQIENLNILRRHCFSIP